MKKSGLTLIELLIAFAVCVILVVCITAAINGNSAGTTSVSAGNGMTVDTVPIGISFNQATAYQQAIANWQIQHPNREIISVMKAPDIGSNKAIITSKEISEKR